MVKSEGLLSLLADEIINKKGLKVGGAEFNSQMQSVHLHRILH